MLTRSALLPANLAVGLLRNHVVVLTCPFGSVRRSAGIVSFMFPHLILNSREMKLKLLIGVLAVYATGEVIDSFHR